MSWTHMFVYVAAYDLSMYGLSMQLLSKYVLIPFTAAETWFLQLP